MFFAQPMLWSMAVKGVPPGDVVIVLVLAAGTVAMVAIAILPRDKGIALTFAATAAAVAIVGGGEGVCDIIALLGESWVCHNFANTRCVLLVKI